MAQRVHDLAVHVRDHLGGVGPDARGVAALPGFGEMKIKALGAVLAKRFGVEAAEVTGRIAFFNEHVDIVVDGTPLERAVTPWSRR